ncbi:MAG: hypothetical protein R3F05_15290 [Planctomycetota bacterium]
MAGKSKEDEPLGWLDVLERTYDDERLSRTEARALSAWLEAQRLSPSRRRALRSEAFRFATQQAAGAGVGDLLAWLEGVLARVDAAVEAQQPAPTAGPTPGSGPGPTAWARFSRRGGACASERTCACSRSPTTG